MKSRIASFVGIGAAIVLVAGLVGCGGSTTKPGTSPATTQLNAQLVSSQHAVGDLLDACLRGDTHAVEQQSVSTLRAQPWDTVCHAISDHHVTLVSDAVDLHGNTMKARVVLRTADSHPLRFDETWHFEYHSGVGWELTDMPEIMHGGWDHDQHVWATTTSSNAPNHSSTTIGHTTPSTHDAPHGDDHTETTPTSDHHSGSDHGSTPTTDDHGDHTGTTHDTGSDHD